MRKITQTIVGTTPPLDKNVIWLDSTDNTAPVEKVFINGQWTPMGIDTDDYYTKEEVNNKLDEKLDVIETPVNGNLIAMDSQGQAIDSGKKTTDFIANPASEGQEGEVLSVDSEGNPVWTTVTPTGTADTGMSDTSTNAVQNKVIKSYVDDNFARKDGYYSQMTVGSAENLVGQTVDSEAYLIRPTGGTENEVANGVASVLGIEGNSVVWNQLHPSNYNDAVSNGVTVHLENGIYTCNNTINATYFSVQGLDNSIGFHYLSCKVLKDTNGVLNNVYFKLMNRGFACSIVNGVASVIYNNTSTEAEKGRGIGFVGIVNGSVFTDVKFVIKDINLTQMFGAGNEPSTVAEFEAWLAQHVGTKPYYPYNAGTILSAQTLGIKTYGQNLLNPTTKQAKLIPYTWVENDTTYSNQYTIKNVPSGATATYTPDNTGVAESVTITDDKFDITSYGSGILELSAATADTYVCIRWNGTKDNDVVPYEDHTYDFDVRKVYGKVNGAGEYVQCFSNGMRSTGSVHDSLTASEAVVKTIVYDLGDLNWKYDDSFNIIVNLAGQPKISQIFGLSSRYEVVNASRNNLTDRQIGHYSNTVLNRIVVKDSNIVASDIVYSKVAKLNGVYLCCALATPITYTDLVYRDNGVDRPLVDVLMNITINNWSMEEQLLTPYDDGNPTSIPATIKTQYGMDAVEAIDTLQKTCYFADDVRANLQALLTCINTNCAETLGGTFAISETATDKVFEFTFTPNTEPDVEPTNEVGE